MAMSSMTPTMAKSRPAAGAGAATGGSGPSYLPCMARFL
eukprot:CAMPEP_0181463810 /NCGR_PEP_ID=MMETSP1110-20121109/35106_1 /TAXON_ID=174948 /ORGANISM="Symbiodinium sp., Strain CCMP421" /LENGTH=38 /DNA_ID= /DNA_START= /DNA_END= /DNA_ORIENTATION=